MAFQFLPFYPPGGLKPYLRRSFFARGRIPYQSDKILPNGLVALLFTLDGPHRLGQAAIAQDNPRYERSWLHGVQTAPLFNTPEDGTHVLGLLFEPLGFHALFGVDMQLLTDRTVAADTVLPAAFLSTLEALLPDAHTARGHAALHARLQPAAETPVPPWLWGFYNEIRAARGMMSLRDAYRTVNHSPRHINAAFKTAVGVSPKTLCRIHRLGALLAAIDPAEPVRWADLAAGYGYYDQAHFNRDFRHFSGLSPRDYLDRRRRDLPALGRGESVHFAPQR